MATLSQRVLMYLFFAATLASLASCNSNALDVGEPGNLVPHTVDENPDLPTLSLNGSQFHIETFGTPGKPVIVFLHGGPGGDYRSLLRLQDMYNGHSLADNYFLVFWDQRGAGLSRRHAKSDVSIDIYKEDLRQIVEHFSPSAPVVLIGHSWGGMYATAFINEYPAMVRGAVLLESGPLTGALYEEIKTRLISLDFFSEWLNDFAWSQQFISADDHARWDFQRLLGMKQSQPEYYQDMNTDPAPFWRLGAAANQYILEDGMDDKSLMTYNFADKHLPDFTTEVLFVASGNNTVIGREFQERQRHLYPQSRLEVIPGCGHDLQWKKPAECVVAIRTYLNTLP